MRRLTIVGMAALVLLLTPGAAAGGGWWTGARLKQHTAVGQRMKATVHSYFLSADQKEAVEAGQLVFHAFLIPELDDALMDRAMSRPFRRGWWEPQPNSIDLGPVTFRDLAAPVPRAISTFTVPEVSPGHYSLMFCTPGCTEAMGDVVPTGFNIEGSAAHAAAENRADRLEQEVWSLRSEKNREIRKLRRQLTHERDRSESFEEEFGRLDERIDDLATRPRAVSQPMSEEGMPDGSLLALGAIAGALGAFVAMRWRGARARPEAPSPEPFASL